MKLFRTFSRLPTSLGGRVFVNTSALAGANLWRIVVSFLVQLLVARFLGLEELGQYTVAMAYLNISQVLCEMGLPLWMVRQLAQAPHLRRAYFQRGVLLQVTSSLVIALLLVLLMSLLPYPQSTRMAIYWVGASLPLFAVTSATATIFQAAERLTLAVVTEFTSNLLILLLSLWLLWQQHGVANLLLAVVVSQGVGMLAGLALLFSSRLLAKPQEKAPLPLGEAITGTLPFLGLSLTDVLLQRLDILLLSLFADARLLGAYSAAYNLVRVAVKLLQSIWRGVYPTLARLYPTTPQQAERLAKRIFLMGFLLCSLAALVTGLLSAPILRLVYGADGGINTNALNGTPDGVTANHVVTVFRWLIWQAPLFFLELYATTWLLVVQRARTALGVALLHVLLLVLLLPVGAVLMGAVGAAWGTLGAQAVAAGVSLWLLRPRRISR